MKDEKTNREKRRIRRIRNQIMAYITLVIITAFVFIAGFFAVRGVVGYVKNYNDRVNKVMEEAESSAASEITK